MSSVRCFVGIGPEPEVRGWLHDVRMRIVADAPGWADEKWVKDENLHVTVRFLGDVGPGELDELCAALERRFALVEPYELSVRGVEARPGPRRARMLWVAVSDFGDGFASTVDSVDSACEGFDIELDGKPQRPHITLCRARRQRSMPPDVLAQVNGVVTAAGPIVSVRSVSLYASQLTSCGPQYETIGTWRLDARGERGL